MTIGLKRDDGDGDEEEKTTVRSVPDGSDNNAQTLCKTRFGSQGVILDGFKAKKNEKTLMALETPP